MERDPLTEKVIGCAKRAGIGRGLLLNFNVELSQGRNHSVQAVTMNSVYSVPSVVSRLAEHMPMNRSRFALASSLSGYFIRSRWLSKEESKTAFGADRQAYVVARIARGPQSYSWKKRLAVRSAGD